MSALTRYRKNDNVKENEIFSPLSISQIYFDKIIARGCEKTEFISILIALCIDV